MNVKDRMPESSLVTVYTCFDLEQAEFIRKMLGDQNIPSEIGGIDQNELARSLGIEILVRQKDAGRAGDAIKIHLLKKSKPR